MTYVMSDIHGHRERFDSIMKQINLQPGDKLYILGDVIDRNRHGLSILYQLMHMPNVTILLGNHEHMMLDALENPDDPWALGLWYDNGGEVTHYHWKRIPVYAQRMFLQYLKSLPINVSIQVDGKKYLLVHGAPEVCWRKDMPKYENATVYAVWERLDPDTEYIKGQTIIFGHTPTLNYQDGSPLRIWEGENKIGIDCGCAYPVGCLACLRLEDGEVFYAQ